MHLYSEISLAVHYIINYKKSLNNCQPIIWPNSAYNVWHRLWLTFEWSSNECLSGIKYVTHLLLYLLRALSSQKSSFTVKKRRGRERNCFVTYYYRYLPKNIRFKHERKKQVSTIVKFVANNTNNNNNNIVVIQ